MQAASERATLYNDGLHGHGRAEEAGSANLDTIFAIETGLNKCTAMSISMPIAKTTRANLSVNVKAGVLYGHVCGVVLA